LLIKNNPQNHYNQSLREGGGISYEEIEQMQEMIDKCTSIIALGPENIALLSQRQIELYIEFLNDSIQELGEYFKVSTSIGVVITLREGLENFQKVVVKKRQTIID
jgi:hypothetical protein